MGHKRILTVQDISCVGQCSLTVALPVLSACGHETCVLPTETLSTHTGLPGAEVHHPGRETLDRFWHHWQRAGITFDAVYTGYLGSVDAVEVVLELVECLLKPEGLLIVDPAMADHGRMYAGLDGAYAESMKALSHRADILIPNLTEAVMLAGKPWREQPEEGAVRELMDCFQNPHVILTGVGFRPGETGAAYTCGGKTDFYTHPKVDGRFSGTGDLFAACFTGVLLRGHSLSDAVRIAADYTARCVLLTREAPGRRYGIRFEEALPWLVRALEKESSPPWGDRAFSGSSSG